MSTLALRIPLAAAVTGEDAPPRLNLRKGAAG